MHSNRQKQLDTQIDLHVVMSNTDLIMSHAFMHTEKLIRAFYFQSYDISYKESTTEFKYRLACLLTHRVQCIIVAVNTPGNTLSKLILTYTFFMLCCFRLI